MEISARGKKQISGWGIIELVAGLGWLAHTSTHSKPETFFTGKLLNPEPSNLYIFGLPEVSSQASKLGTHTGASGYPRVPEHNRCYGAKGARVRL